MSKLIQIVGPSFTNYSLARVNRGLALAMTERAGDDWRVEVVSNHKFAERDPDAADLKAFPELSKLLVDEIDPEAIVIYNNFPRDPNGPYGISAIEAKLKIVYLAWESSLFPQHWVVEFNEHADFIFTSSSFVRTVLDRSGVRVPMLVAHNAIDEQVFADKSADKYQLQTKRSYKFLHISSGFPRKGTDVLLEAYQQAFSKRDDVCLVLKSMPNALNSIPKQVAEIQSAADAPEIELINAELSDQELVSLFNAVDASVYPTRAEGFGLPIAESMLRGIPTIATAYGAHLDFFGEETGYLLDYHMVPAHESQLVDLGAAWAQPHAEHLAELLQQVRSEQNSPQQLDQIELARQAASQLRWENTAKLMLEEIEDYHCLPQLRDHKLTVISEYNNQSGVAEYTNYLHDKIAGNFERYRIMANDDVADLVTSDPDFVVRNWTTGELKFDRVVQDIETDELVHIEYHSAKIKPHALAKLLDDLTEQQVVLTLHSAADDLAKFTNSLSKCQQIIVHSQLELDKLERFGLSNVVLMIHGNTLPVALRRNSLRSTLEIAAGTTLVATHGLLTDQKGLENLIRAKAELPKDYQVKLLLLNAVSSNNITSNDHWQYLQNLVAELDLVDDVVFVTDFLERRQVLSLLQLADINVLAYDNIAEGASGAVRMLLAADRPMLLTDIPMFDDVHGLATLMPDNQPSTIASAIERLITTGESISISESRNQYLGDHNWYRKSLELAKIYCSILGV